MGILVCFGSVFGVEEGDDAVSNVPQELVELLLGVEAVVLVESGVVVAEMFPYFLVEVPPEGWHHQHHAPYDRQSLQDTTHLHRCTTTLFLD